MAYIQERRSSDVNSAGTSPIAGLAKSEDLMSKLGRLTARLRGLRFAAKAVAEKVEGYYEEAEDTKVAEVSTTAHGYASEALEYLSDIERIVEQLHNSLGERPLPPQSQPTSLR